jgi:hypothetical protein
MPRFFSGVIAPITAVIARLDRATQYTRTAAIKL